MTGAGLQKCKLSDLQKIFCPNAVVWHGRGLVPAVSAGMISQYVQIHDFRTIFEQFPTVSHQGPKMFWG